MTETERRLFLIRLDMLIDDILCAGTVKALSYGTKEKTVIRMMKKRYGYKISERAIQSIIRGIVEIRV